MSGIILSDSTLDQEEARGLPDHLGFGDVARIGFSSPLSDSFEDLERRLSGVLFAKDGRPRLGRPEEDAARAAFESAMRERARPRVVLQASASDERIVLTGAEAKNALTWNQAQTIPPDLFAAYQLAEYYWSSEGDVRQTIEIPIDLALRPIQIEHADPDVVSTFSELCGPGYLDLDTVLADIWLSQEIYGVAYTQEIWDKRLPDKATTNDMARGKKDPIVSSPQSVNLLNPKYVYVGAQPYTGQAIMALSPSGDEGAAFREQLIQNRVPPMTYNSFSFDVHESLLWAWNIPLDPASCTQIRDKANSFVRYPWPSLMSCFRTLSTRQILEEMIRATIEGTKNQLWAFVLGEKTGERRPRKEDIEGLKAVIASAAGARTHTLVWGGAPLDIQIYAPVVDQLLANEKWQRLTDHFFRQRGISMRMVSGESSSTSSGGGVDADGIDVKVFTERMNYKRTAIERSWLNPFIRKICLFSGDPKLVALVRTNNLPVVKFGDFGIQMESDLKNRIMPSYSAGLMSPQTAMKKQGLNYETEMANHKAADKEELLPPASYAQAVVGPDGKSATKGTSGGSNGTHAKKKPAAVKASVEGESDGAGG